MKKLLIVSFIFIIFSCSSNRSDKYIQIINENNNSNIKKSLTNTDFKNAVRIKFNTKHVGKIEEIDELIKIKGMPSANYDLFKLKINHPDKINIDIFSYCDCFGFDKNLFDPHIIIFDPLKRPIYLDQKVVNKNNGYLRKYFSTTLNKKGLYYILVLSNNKKLKTKMAAVNSYSSSGYGDVIMEGIAIYSSPYGKYRIFVTAP